ncbi:MAG: radical SAM protein, partial [Candidatus Omnitrophica bacterium]|nr:radical SAM protein [Candidatus Omnitrophota bacterium]
MKPEKQISYDFRKKPNIIAALSYRGADQRRLFEYARKIRDAIFLKKVEVRSVIEYSNICQQACNYCGMHKGSRIKRYIFSDEEFLGRVETLYNRGRRIIMIQTGESDSDAYFDTLYGLLKRVKDRHSDLTLICSFGSLHGHKYKKLREIGIERYLLKFETS